MKKVAASLVAILIVAYYASTFTVAVKATGETADKIKSHKSQISIAANL